MFYKNILFSIFKKKKKTENGFLLLNMFSFFFFFLKNKKLPKMTYMYFLKFDSPY